MEMHLLLRDILQVERRLTRDTIVAMADGDMAFRPTPGQMSFGDQALHIISAQETLQQALQNGEWDWDRGIDSRSFPTQEAILSRFDDLNAREVAYYGGLQADDLQRTVHTAWGPPEPILKLLVSFLAHEAHHRGQMVAYLRLKGMTPPAY